MYQIDSVQQVSISLKGIAYVKNIGITVLFLITSTINCMPVFSIRFMLRSNLTRVYILRKEKKSELAREINLNYLIIF